MTPPSGVRHAGFIAINRRARQHICRHYINVNIERLRLRMTTLLNIELELAHCRRTFEQDEREAAQVIHR